MKVCQLIPRIGSLGSGVGDYAALLAGRLDEGHGIESNFLAVELGPDACKVGRTAKSGDFGRGLGGPAFLGSGQLLSGNKIFCFFR
jgi:hypothetical protein